MSKSGAIIGGLVGIAAGEEIADKLIDDDNILGHVATGIVAAGITGAITKKVIDEVGVVGDY